ncbi:capsule polysaccharide biosynthesis protein [Biscogniauxia mediterranea]|nr:capsule polysaccharide biosynthesis protein [Biscogniauxia mediterranea]
MASAAGSANRVLRVAGPILLPAIAYGVYKGNAMGAIESFFTGPGRTSRIVALVVVLVNWKSLPFAWTFRVWGAMVSHLFIRKYHTYTPDKLFQPVVSESHVSLLEVDYNIHKSNSTYFADLDVSRSHLVSHLFARGCQALANNPTTKLVMNPSDPSQPAKGRFGVMLGAVHCSFKKELQPFQRYETWSRLLSWDRKWMYIVTQFVETGTAKKGEGKSEGWEKRVFATAVSKYVFKIGRLTVHPSVIIEASGLLPERPGGWITTESGLATPAEVVNRDGSSETEADSLTWDWRRTEQERLKGHEYAEHFAMLDGLHEHFDAGERTTLGRFALG